MGVDVVMVVFVGLDVGEDAVEEGGGGVGVGVDMCIASVAGLLVLGEVLKVAVPMAGQRRIDVAIFISAERISILGVKGEVEVTSKEDAGRVVCGYDASE